MRTHTFNTSTGKRKYKVHIDHELEGYADVPERKPEYGIYISTALTPREAITVALHESAHAIRPDMSEAQVEALTAEQGRFLLRYMLARDMLK